MGRIPSERPFIIENNVAVFGEFVDQDNEPFQQELRNVLKEKGSITLDIRGTHVMLMRWIRFLKSFSNEQGVTVIGKLTKIN